MRRRWLLTGTGISLAQAAFAQPRPPLIGFLNSRSPEEARGHMEGFLRGLRAFGFVPSQSVLIEERWARGNYALLPGLAQELLALRPVLLAAPGGTPPALAPIHEAAGSVPVLFLTSDALHAGLVTQLNHSGAAVSGVDIMAGELGGKRVELLDQLLPGHAAFGFLVNRDGVALTWEAAPVTEAARALGRTLVTEGVSADISLQVAFRRPAGAGIGGLVVQNDPSFDARRKEILGLAARYRLPAIYHIREFPAAGGLMSYGANLEAAYFQLGQQVGRVLRGAPVAELPVVRPTLIEFVVNLRTATAIGITVPPRHARARRRGYRVRWRVRPSDLHQAFAPVSARMLGPGRLAGASYGSV